MSPILVTHIYPHLDDVTAIWLMKRFGRAYAGAKLKFVPTHENGVKLKKGEVGLGVGRGKFDEHKGDRTESAASLVWKDLRARRLLPRGRRGLALAELVDYVRRGDLGEFIGQPGNFFNLSALLQSLAGLPEEDSRSATLIGLRVLDALFELYEEKLKVEQAVSRGVTFASPWGRGVGIVCDALPGIVSSYIAERGFALVILRHPSGAYLHLRATPDSKTDFSRLAKFLVGLEPDKHWYLHHSKKMLLQGDLVAPTEARTRQDIRSLIRLIRGIYPRPKR